MSYENRKRPRIKIDHIVTYTGVTNKSEELVTKKALLIDISTSGAMIETKEPLNKNNLILGNDSETNPKMVIGEVVHIDTIDPNEKDTYGVYRSGIMFTDSIENAKEFVVSIVRADESDPETSMKREIIPATEGYTFNEIDSEPFNQNPENDEATEQFNLTDILDDSLSLDNAEDALDSIADVFEEEIINDQEKDLFPVAEVEASHTEQGSHWSGTTDYALSQPKNRFLFYFNASTALIIGITALCAFFFIQPANCNTNCRGIEIPFYHAPPSLITQKNTTPIMTTKGVTTLLKSSIKGRLSSQTNSTSSFVIKGVVSTPSDKTPEDIILTARLFNNQNLIIGKTTTMPGNIFDPSIEKQTKKGLKSNQKLIPFQITIKNPSDKVVRFSVDIE